MDTILHQEFMAKVGPHLVSVDFYYYPDDPHAVTMVPASKEEVVWKFHRSLLAGGGEGDVKVAQGISATAIQLSPPGGVAILVFKRKDIQSFLAGTYNMIPEGKEAEHINWDEEFEFMKEA